VDGPLSHGADPARLDVILYDSHCRLCVAAARRLRRLLPPDQVILLSFREPGVLARFPQLSLERCERAMQLVIPGGRTFEGAEALVQGLRHRRWGRLACVYYLPGLRQLIDGLYRLVARYRFRFFGHTCDGEACAGHLK